MVYYEDDILVAVGETLQLNQFIIDREIGQGEFSIRFCLFIRVIELII